MRNSIPVSRNFRDLLVEAYPQAFEEVSYARLFQELLFPWWRDRDTKKTVLSQSVLAELEGKEADLVGKRYDGLAFLRAFQRETGVPIVWREADWRRNKARTAHLAFPVELQVALSIELQAAEKTEMVDFVTGRPISPRQLERRRAARRAARSAYVPPEGPNAWYLHVLNSTPSHVCKRFEQFLDPAVDVAGTIEQTGRRLTFLSILHVLRQDGIDPTYQAVERSLRMYTMGQSVAHLSSNLRNVVLGLSIHADLSAAQLAILAKLWGLPSIEEMLWESMARGTSPWTPLLQEVGLEAKHKSNFKRLIYATAYGMGEAKLDTKAQEWLGEDQVQRLFQTPLMTELLEGRAARRRRLRAEGGIVDAFGQSIRLVDREGRGGKSPESSLLAHEAQSYELLVMTPALDLAAVNPEFRIALWLHDGLYFVVTQPERKARYIGQLTREIDAQARGLGFATALRTADLSLPPFGMESATDDEE